MRNFLAFVAYVACVALDENPACVTRWLTVLIVSWDLVGCFRRLVVGVDVVEFLSGPGRGSVDVCQPAASLTSAVHLYTLHGAQLVGGRRRLVEFGVVVVSSEVFLGPLTRAVEGRQSCWNDDGGRRRSTVIGSHRRSVFTAVKLLTH